MGHPTKRVNPMDSRASVRPAKHCQPSLKITALTTTNTPPILR
jgi:hypothetical protein